MGGGQQLLPSQFPVQLLSARAHTHTHTHTHILVLVLLLLLVAEHVNSDNKRTHSEVERVGGAHCKPGQDHNTISELLTELSLSLSFVAFVSFPFTSNRDPNHQPLWR